MADQVYAIVLAGGIGSRLKNDRPKQYIEVNGIPVIGYVLKTFEENEYVSKIIVVCNTEWRDYLDDWMKKIPITKFCGYADGGDSRQASIYSGLKLAKECGIEDDDVVVIHDSARPNMSQKVLTDVLLKAKAFDGCLATITVKDGCYYSEDGEHVKRPVDRDKLHAGQTPEVFKFGKYYHAHYGVSNEELKQFRGTSEIGLKHGMDIHIVAGEDINYKITTMEDLEKFRLEQEGPAE